MIAFLPGAQLDHMPADQIGEKLADLIFFALDHGIESVRDSEGSLVPFVALENVRGERTIQRFVTETLEVSVDGALAFIKTSSPSSRAVAAYDGYITIDGDRKSAVIVVGRERDATSTVLFAQRYSPSRLFRRFQTVGIAIFIGPGPE